MQLTLEPTLVETLKVIAAISNHTPESLAVELLHDAVRSAVEDTELLGIADGKDTES